MHQTYFRILSAKLLDCQLRQKCYQIFFLICASLKMSILCESLHSNNINWRERVDDGIDEWKLRAVKSRKCASVHINDAIHNSLNVFKVLGMRKLPEGLLYAWNRKSMSGSILCRKYTQVRAHFMHVPLFIHHTLHTLYLPYYGENHFGNDFCWKFLLILNSYHIIVYVELCELLYRDHSYVSILCHNDYLSALRIIEAHNMPHTFKAYIRWLDENW